MEIVIDISIYDIEWINNANCIPDILNEKIADAIIDGTPILERHGKLIDADEALKAMSTYDKFGYLPHDLIPLHSENGLNLIPYVKYDDMVACISNMPSIVEADKEVE